MRNVSVIGGALLFLVVGCGTKSADSSAPADKKAAMGNSNSASNPGAPASTSAAAAPAATPSASASASAVAAVHPTCDMRAERDICAQYVKSDDAAMKHAQEFCSVSKKNIFSTGGCPKENLLGTCDLGSIQYYYYSNGREKLTAEQEKKKCGASTGTWTPTP